MRKNQILASINQKITLILFLIMLSFPVFSQEVEDVLPESFYGNWVEPFAECDGVDGYRIEIVDSEKGLLLSSNSWTSEEVQVKNMGSYYRLVVDANSATGIFQFEIKIRMSDEGSLFLIDTYTEEIVLVNCDSTEFFEYESEEIALADSGLNAVELDTELTFDPELLELDLPLIFYGSWVEDLSDCNGVTPFSIVNSEEEGLLISGLDWYSTEVKVMSTEGYYTLTMKGLSEEGEFDTEIIIGMDEDENLIVSVDGGETGSKLVKCNPINNEYDGVDMGPEVSDLQEIEDSEVGDSVVSEPINIDLLQGKWQSVEDESKLMIIEGDKMIIILSGGSDAYVDEMNFIVSDSCKNESNEIAADLVEKVNGYISVFSLDICFSISSLDATDLQLVNWNDFNLYKYKRVK
jgi:hypothetical protein